MVHITQNVDLMRSSPGTHRSIKVHRFGTIGARPKIYIQAALHANETPGLLIAHHIIRLLQKADAQGAITGEVVIVPFANPIGLSDNVLGNQIGREALDGGGNYNRGWPDLATAVVDDVINRLGEDAETNVKTVRAAMKHHLHARSAQTEVSDLQLNLLKLSYDCDFIIDLHTELQAVLSIVVTPWSLASMQPLIGALNPDLVHVTDTPTLFDSICSKVWAELWQRVGSTLPIPQATTGITLEMRGVTDVDDTTAAANAMTIVEHLARTGAIRGETAPAPEWKGRMTPHEAIAMIRTSVDGVIVYPYPLGTVVEAGSVVAEIVDPESDDPSVARTPIVSQRPGMIYATVLNRLVRPNDIVIKIAATDF